MADWDATASATANGSSTNDQNSTTIMDELREALAMVTEKTEECEELRRQKCELDKEVSFKRSLVKICRKNFEWNFFYSDCHV